jgi:hypothetical protein
MNGDSGNPRKLRGEWKLPHDRGSMGKIFYQLRVTEPEIQIKIVRHAGNWDEVGTTLMPIIAGDDTNLCWSRKILRPIASPSLKVWDGDGW